MQRFLEILLGLDPGFLARDGELLLRFRPRWPLQDILGASAWNLFLVVGAVLLVVWVYRREGKTRRWRILLAAGRMAILLLVIGLLNRPTLSLTNARVEPSVLAILVDDSVSMQVRDLDSEQSRLDAAKGLLLNNPMAAQLAEDHSLRMFRFGGSATALDADDLESIAPVSDQTAVAAGIADVLRQLRGQNLAGVVVLTDGRDAPARSETEFRRAIRAAGVPVYPIPVGGAGEPVNLQVEAVAAEPTVFAGDVLNVLTTVRATGFTSPTAATVQLLDREGNPVLDPEGQPVVSRVELRPGEATEVELQLETNEPAALDMTVAILPDADDVDETTLDDNRRPLRVDVLDAQITVLYVEGYPRWEYRYLKNRLVRDQTLDASILLTSADPTFVQEGNRPIRRFPVSMEELLAYDVVIFGDVSPDQFSDGQLELLREFVGENGGGFGMVAGPRSSPWMWTDTPIEALLPVDVVATPSESSALSVGWRPVVTEAGSRTGIFRFFSNREANEQFLVDGIEELFWFADGVRAKAGVGDVLAQHPEIAGPDGRPAPLLVAGRYGAGRTLFNGIDDSWRWRYYTGEGVFDTFWVQQLRYLARGRKLGERRATLAIQQPAYEVGQTASAELRLLDPLLAQQLPDRLDAVLKDAEGRPVRSVALSRRSGESGQEADRYTGTFPTDIPGGYQLVVPSLGPDVPELSATVAVELPRAELESPSVDRSALARLALDTGGEVVPIARASQLPGMIASAEKRVPVIVDRALWDAPLALGLLALLLSAEWAGRKFAGLI